MMIPPGNGGERGGGANHHAGDQPNTGGGATSTGVARMNWDGWVEHYCGTAAGRLLVLTIIRYRKNLRVRLSSSSIELTNDENEYVSFGCSNAMAKATATATATRTATATATKAAAVGHTQTQTHTNTYANR